MQPYFNDIWKARHFWWHLAMSDLRARFRRSFFGILWAIFQPLGLTILISVVFGRLFGQEVLNYAPYVLSGIIIWEYLSSSTIGGSVALLHAESYIKQTRHPLAIYTLRIVLANLVVLAIGSLALIGWVIVALPGNVGGSWLAAPTIFPMILLIAWPLSTIMAYIGVRFRGLPNALALIVQAAWFVSPVYFKEMMFRDVGLHGLIDYNPVYHLMQIVRAPLLQGEWPTATNYLWCLGTAAGLALVAAAIGARSEKKVIFYL